MISRDQSLSLIIILKRWATRVERGDLPKATQPVNPPSNGPMSYLFSLEEKMGSFRDLSGNREAAWSPGAIYVSKLQPGKLAAEGRRPGVWLPFQSCLGYC